MGLESLIDLVDEDIRKAANGVEYRSHVVVCLLAQILRELKKEGPEERSKPIRGFGAGTDASEPYHPF